MDDKVYTMEDDGKTLKKTCASRGLAQRRNCFYTFTTSS